MMKRASLLGLALLAGCGGSSRPAPDPFAPVPGPRVDGKVLMLCGPKPDRTLDVYSLEDGVLQRLTASREGSGVNSFDVHGETIALSRDGWPEFWGLVGDVTTLGPVPLARGTSVGEAHNVALRDDHTIAFARRVVGRGDLINYAIYIKRLGSPARRVATYRSVWDLQWVRGRLTARATLPRSRSALVTDVGGKRKRTIHLKGESRYSIGAAAIAADGRLAYTDTHVGDRALIWFVSPGGKHLRSFATRWFPTAWTPDGKRVLVTRARGSRTTLGMMNPRTGRVKEIGPVPCGYAFGFRWR
ncbi:hypothetical protein OJ997_07855 [Solirubrobacter phytolaccae]|uniref:Uncharacterized protein n=1 Tax=Solirubrobacter phytolaccae TaxID=1404360 RepID=A0A9X3N864_9ACTN|nr:hypothetical protein [Solirubrobacter phytolaccae]MDA0180204.1 hypothetical protein [Solirubrobacter phytolaccae]